MRVVRNILAFAIALSLAMLPIGASAARLAMPSDEMQTSMHMTGADMSMDECCPDDMDGAPTHTYGYKCGVGFCCVSGILAVGDVRSVRFDLLSAAATRVLIPDDQIGSARLISPPFRPPRV